MPTDPPSAKERNAETMAKDTLGYLDWHLSADGSLLDEFCVNLIRERQLAAEQAARAPLEQRIAELLEAAMPLYDHEPSPKELRRFREAIDAARGERDG